MTSTPGLTMEQAYNTFEDYTDYTVAAKDPGTAFVARRKRINLVAVAVNALLPPAVFVLTFGLLTSSFHFFSPRLVGSAILLVFLVALAVCFLAGREREREREPSWYTFAAGSLMLSVVLGAFLGDLNYHYNIRPFYEQETMTHAEAVDPSKSKGQQFMDTGKLGFAPSATLDLKKAMLYKSMDSYCVAPITSGAGKLASYDFWAVGTNCCPGGVFRCGEYNNPKAKSGVRLMDDAERAFYKLAVQQAEAAYDIKAAFPLFFHWVADPMAAVTELKQSGLRYIMISGLTYLAFNLFLVACAVVVFNKMG